MSAEPKQNYFTMKDSELQAIMDMYKLPYDADNFNRKEAVGEIKIAEAKGGINEGVVEDENGVVGKIAGKEKTEYWKVVFHNTATDDIPYVFVGHNGKAFYIPKEMEVIVPKYILMSCIKDAIEYKHVQITDTDGTITHKTRPIQRYPYTIVETGLMY